MANIARDHRYPFELKYCLSPSHRRTYEESKSDAQGYAESLCSAEWKELEKESIVRRVLLQE
jgi:hypothetical protein